MQDFLGGDGLSNPFLDSAQVIDWWNDWLITCLLIGLMIDWLMINWLIDKWLINDWFMIDLWLIYD